jgi:hypothetical protein
MSKWTHVVGAVRIDWIPVIQKPDLERRLGIQVHWKFEDGDLQEIKTGKGNFNVPGGSEGSLHYEISEYGTGAPWAIITIWGDLRDFGEPDEVEKIVSWLDRALGDLIIRDGIIRIEVEGKRPMIFQPKSQELKKTVFSHRFIMVAD